MKERNEREKQKWLYILRKSATASATQLREFRGAVFCLGGLVIELNLHFIDGSVLIDNEAFGPLAWYLRPD
jgi:hypothetical protein